MRIRRRPQAQALNPSPPHQPSDPSTAPSQPPPPPSNSPQHWLIPGKEGDVEARRLGELHRPNVDLADEHDPLPSHPQWQGNNVMVGHSSQTAPGRRRGGGGGAQAQHQGAAATADGHAHGSQDNEDRDKSKWLVISAGEERLVNGVIQAMQVAPPMAAVHTKEGIKSDGPKRRRGPAVLLEGSQCSRVNGRGWRCSQPTLVGYALCEHHLGKGRQSRSANGGGHGGRSACAPKLGRTEPASGKKSTAAQAVVTIAAANEPPALRHI